MPDMPQRPGAQGAPGDLAGTQSDNRRLRAELERLLVLNEDKDALLAGRDAEIAQLRDESAAQAAVIAQLEAQGADRDALLAEMRDELERLRRQVSRNSGNSSMPPSTDDLPGRKPPRPRRPGRHGKRKPGKQPGTAGASLPWRDDPDDTKDVFPQGSCGCGADLAQAADLGVAHSHQVTDIPAVKATTIQYDRHRVECQCGRRHTAGPPGDVRGAPGTVTYGLKLQAWAVFMMVMQHIPVERCADILESMSGIRPSDGWVHALLARAAKAVRGANAVIRAMLVTARVVCGDETPLRCGPGPRARKMYLQVACTNLLTHYFLGDRGLGSFRNFVYSDLSGTVVVHDRYVNYDRFPGISHQLCCAHLLRDLEDAAQCHPDATWAGQIADALRALIHQANLARKRGEAVVPADAIASYLHRFRHGVLDGLSQVPRIPGGSQQKQPPGRLLLECLKDREDDVLRFLTDTQIPPTNNQAERDARPAKTQQKISGRLRSAETTRDRYAVRGYASTARKHGIDTFTAIHDALAGHAWTPPGQANA